MLVLKTSNFQGTTVRPIVPSHKHSIAFYHQFFFSSRQFQSHIEVLSTFLDERQMLNLKNKTNKNPLNTISIAYFL